MATMIRLLRPYLAWLEMVSYISVIVTSTLTYVNVRVKNAFWLWDRFDTWKWKKQFRKKLAELKQLTIPWEPSADKIKTGDGKEDYTYAYKIRHETDGNFINLSNLSLNPTLSYLQTVSLG